MEFFLIQIQTAVNQVRSLASTAFGWVSIIDSLINKSNGYTAVRFRWIGVPFAKSNKNRRLGGIKSIRSWPKKRRVSLQWLMLSYSEEVESLFGGSLEKPLATDSQELQVFEIRPDTEWDKDEKSDENGVSRIVSRRDMATQMSPLCSPESSPPYVEALSRLNVVIRHPNALQPENVMAYDNAVSALGKICQFHCDSIDSVQIIPAWLSCLPIKGDHIEAKSVHELLCSMVERSDMELLVPNNQYIPKIVSVFTEILCADKDLATEQTISRIVNLLRQLQQTLPPAVFASIWQSLQPQQLAIQSVLTS